MKLTQETISRLFAEANARAYFCKDCRNWQLKASHPGRCPADDKNRRLQARELRQYREDNL